MSIVKKIADHFKFADKTKRTDRYGVLSPLLEAGDYISATSAIYVMFKGSMYADLVSGKTRPTNKSAEKAVQAYRDYVKALPSQDQAAERSQPFSTILATLDSISGNIAKIEDNFQTLFGNLNTDTPESTLRSSSLVVIGYLERTSTYSVWLGNLVEHLTADVGDLIPPFRTKDLLSKATEASAFASFNLHKWNSKTDNLINEVSGMQKSGSDVAVYSDTAGWIDDFAHDNQFTNVEQDLMTASLRSSIMIGLTMDHVHTQNRIDRDTSRKDWLTSKTIMLQAKLRGMDIDSPEYKKMKKVTERYADLVSKYDQKIERMRS